MEIVARRPFYPAAVVHTPQMDYVEAWETQKRLAYAREKGRISDVVWLLEHPPVYTTGRHGSRADLHISDEMLQGRGASFHVVDRGGQMTWHGPGQTTGYVMMLLPPSFRVRDFVTALLESMARASGLDNVEVDPLRMGVYVDGRKLGSVGIRVRNRVTYHGIALNRDPDLGWSELMTACGAPDVQATSIAHEGGDPDRARVERDLSAALTDTLGLSLHTEPLDELLQQAQTPHR